MRIYVGPHSTFTCKADTLQEFANSIINPRIANAPVNKKKYNFLSNKMHGLTKNYFNNNDTALGGFINEDEIEQIDNNLNNTEENQANFLNNFDIHINFNNLNNINKKNEGKSRIANSLMQVSTCASEFPKSPNSILIEITGATKKSNINKI